MDAFGVLRDVLDDYKSFVQGFLNIRDPDVLEKVERPDAGAGAFGAVGFRFGAGAHE